MVSAQKISEYALRFVGEPYEWPQDYSTDRYVRAWMEYYGMAEKKTFKHSEGSLISTDTAWVFAGYFFPYDRWDFELTFVEKTPNIPVGSRVRSKYHTAYFYTVLAQWKDTVIVVDENDDEIEHFDYDDLVIVS